MYIILMVEVCDLKLWMRLSQRGYAHIGDVAEAVDDE